MIYTYRWQAWRELTLLGEGLSHISTEELFTYHRTYNIHQAINNWNRIGYSQYEMKHHSPRILWKYYTV